MKHICYVMVILLLLFTIFYQWKNPTTITETIVDHHTDTVTLWDTVYKEKPVPITVTKIERDTVYINDTIYIVMDREEKIYEDSTYQCQISGVNAELDWIKVFPKTTTITNERVVQIEQKQPLFEFKPSVGLGWGLTTNKPDLWIGASVVVNINRNKNGKHK